MLISVADLITLNLINLITSLIACKITILFQNNKIFCIFLSNGNVNNVLSFYAKKCKFAGGFMPDLLFFVKNMA